jgi:hypothetical protein
MCCQVGAVVAPRIFRNSRELANFLQHAGASYSDAQVSCYGALAMCMVGCAGPPTPSKFRILILWSPPGITSYFCNRL